MSQLSNPHDVIGRYREVPMLGPNTVARAAFDITLLRDAGPRVVDAHVEEMHASIVLPIVPPDVGESSTGFDHHGDSVELRMPWMKYVTRH
jgi:hypothetical protein